MADTSALQKEQTLLYGPDLLGRSFFVLVFSELLPVEAACLKGQALLSRQCCLESPKAFAVPMGCCGGSCDVVHEPDEEEEGHSVFL